MSAVQEFTRNRPVVFGEVLFDTFPDGRRVLGGAPFNVAWHLQGFGLAPLFLSRVGDDAAGAEIRRAMTDWGMDASGLQTDPERPTGRVEVTFPQGEPAYEIVEDVAWDHIDRAAALAAVANTEPELLYHGSLAARAQVSREALEALRHQSWDIFIDVNLRPPWWQRERIEGFCREAKWVKLNRDELKTLSGGDDVADAATRFAKAFDIGHVVVTCGTEGALMREPEGWITQTPAGETGQVADTVGAGDAFSAVMILGARSGWTPEATLERAAEFAALICGQTGAIASDPGLYQDRLKAWGLAA